jgi:hypothetical protein
MDPEGPFTPVGRSTSAARDDPFALGDVTPARDLVDGIDLSRHQE